MTHFAGLRPAPAGTSLALTPAMLCTVSVYRPVGRCLLAALAIAALACSDTRESPRQVPPDNADQDDELGAPELVFQYSYSIDGFLCDGRGPTGPSEPSPVDLVLLAEALARIDEFQALWDEQGAPLMQEAARVVGRPWLFTGRIPVALYLCGYVDAAGFPLPAQFDFRPFMKTFADQAGLPGPASDAWFLNTVFHEMLHLMVSKTAKAPEGFVMPSDSELSARHCRETKETISMAHLHLHAIQQVVYERLDRDDIVRDTLALYEAFLPEYLMSWKQVERDGAAAYVTELKDVLEKADQGIETPPSLGDCVKGATESSPMP